MAATDISSIQPYKADTGEMLLTVLPQPAAAAPGIVTPAWVWVLLAVSGYFMLKK